MIVWTVVARRRFELVIISEGKSYMQFQLLFSCISFIEKIQF